MELKSTQRLRQMGVTAPSFESYGQTLDTLAARLASHALQDRLASRRAITEIVEQAIKTRRFTGLSDDILSQLDRAALSQLIRDSLREIYHAGYRAFAAEVAAIGGDALPEPPDQEDVLGGFADIVAAGWASRVSTSLSADASMAVQAGKRRGDMIDSALTVGANFLKRAGHEITNAAWGLGREIGIVQSAPPGSTVPAPSEENAQPDEGDEAADEGDLADQPEDAYTPEDTGAEGPELPDQFPFALMYSAAMDRNTCDGFPTSCAELDGTIYQLDDPQIVWPPNKDCLGKRLCRCLLVPIPNQEG